jgi:hypothetical protein
MMIHAGTVVSSEVIRFDSEPDTLGCSGAHPCFFYGDFKNALVHYCQLFGIQPITA